jgi:putative hydrolase of the HAD superfamily
MARQPIRAITIDALGTLLELLPPAPRLQAELRALGVEVSLEQAGRAMKAEIGFYRGHLWMGRDEAGLAALRRRCAEVLREALGLELDLGAIEGALLAAIRFEPFPDAVPALRALRAAGVVRVVVSNWDASLHERLAETGLDGLLDGAVASAEVGAAKPDQAIFARALALAGARANEAWHVGDSVEADVEGALAAGIRPVLLARAGAPAVPPGVPVLAGLDALPGLVAAGDPYA